MIVSIRINNDEVRRAVAQYLCRERGVPMPEDDLAKMIRFELELGGPQVTLSIATTDSFAQGPYR